MKLNNGVVKQVLKNRDDGLFDADDGRKLPPTLHVNIRNFGDVLLQKIDSKISKKYGDDINNDVTAT